MLLLPLLLSNRRPLLCIVLTLVTECIDILRCLHIGGLCTAGLDHGAQLFRILKHRTRLQVVVVEWLILSVLHEQRLLKCLKQRLVLDVR